jgi:hypothetical protein
MTKNMKQKLLSLAVGTLLLTASIHGISDFLLFPHGPTRPYSWRGFTEWTFLWASIFLALRPLIPNDPP